MARKLIPERFPTLLVADDDETERRMLVAVLNAAGFEASDAADGRGLIEEYRQLTSAGRAPRAIVADVLMPGCDGVSALRAIRSEDADTPFIILSGHAEALAVDVAQALAPMVALQKPVEAAALRSLVEHFVYPERPGTAGDLHPVHDYR